jgi:hypothetical protein
LQLLAITGKEGRLTVSGQASVPVIAQLDKLGVDVLLDLTFTNADFSIFRFFFLSFSSPFLKLICIFLL